jgi:hypothetical protein
MADQKEVEHDPQVKGLVETKLKAFLEDEGLDFGSVELQTLSDDRRHIYENAANYLGRPAWAQSMEGANLIVARHTGDETVDFLASRTGEGEQMEVELVLAETGVMMEDVSPTQLVEYQFETGPWRCSLVNEMEYEDFRQRRFVRWKDQLLNPTCAAALRRMLQTGLMDRMYDEPIFPTPEDEIEKYTVVDQNGKSHSIPHGVAAARTWDPQQGEYKQLDIHLPDVPTDEKGRADLWAQTLKEVSESLQKRHSWPSEDADAYVQELLKGSSSSEQ